MAIHSPLGIVAPENFKERPTASNDAGDDYNATRERLAKERADEIINGPKVYENPLEARIAALENLVAMHGLINDLFLINKGIDDRARAWAQKITHDALLSGPSKDRTAAILEMDPAERATFSQRLTKTQVSKLSRPARDAALATMSTAQRAKFVFDLLPLEQLEQVSVTDLSLPTGPVSRFVLKASNPQPSESLLIAEVPEAVSRSAALAEFLRQHAISGGKHELPTL